MSEIKVNPFSLIQFFMHKASFCYTPVSTERFLAQCAQEEAAAERDRKSSPAALLDIKLDLKKRCPSKDQQMNNKKKKKKRRKETLEYHDGYFSYETDDESDEDDEEDEEECDYHQETSEDRDPGNVINVVRFVLLHPVQTLQLIKAYHLVNNWFLFFAAVHLAILAHQTLKSIIMVIVERPNMGTTKKVIGEYYLSQYYPYMVGALTEPYSMNNMVLSLLIYCICSRMLSGYRILRGSLVNQDKYRRIWTTQITLTTFTYLHFTIGQWVTILRQAGRHEHAIKRGREPGANQEDAQQLRHHLHLDQAIMSSLDKYSKRELMYRYNTIDFAQCYLGDELRFFSPLEVESNCKAEDIMREANRTWFTPCFHCRICICSLRTFTLICLLGVCIISSLSGVFLLTVVYSEYITSMRPEDRPESWYEIGSMLVDHFLAKGPIGGSVDWVVKLADYYSKPIHLIRSAEMYIFLLLNIPNHLDAVCVYSDLWVITCRIDKLIGLFDHETKLSNANLVEEFDLQSSHLRFDELQRNHRFAVSSGPEFHQERDLRPPSFVNFDKSPGGTRLYSRQLSRDYQLDVRRTNNRILRIVKLSNLLYYEFIDLRSMHSLYLNLLFIGNGICVSYMLSLFLMVKDPVQLVLISLAIASSMAPVLTSIVYCAMLERRFKTLYITMVQLMNNRDHKLNSKTLERLRVASRLYEKKEGRAMLMFGKYAITQDSMTPIIAYMATAILYLQ